MTNSPSVEHTQDEQHTAEVSKVITMDSKVTFEVTNSNIWLNHLATTTIIQVHRVDPVSFRSFHEDRSLGKHNIQMGLPEGHSVLLHFSNNGRAYQAVLVSMSSAPSKSKKGEHAMWKHVLPVSTDFAWLPEDVADAFCSLALHQDSTRPYGSFHEMQLGFNEHYQALLRIEGLY